MRKPDRLPAPPPRTGIPSRPNVDLAVDLGEMAALLRVEGAERFRVRAYELLGRMVAGLPVPLGEMRDEDIARLRGVGTKLARLLVEYRDTGHIRLLDAMRERHPAGFGQLIRVQGVSSALATRLTTDFGIRDCAGLEAALAGGRLDELGDRQIERVRRGLRRLAERADPRLLLAAGLEQAAELRAVVAQHPGVKAVEVAGDLRRGAEAVTRLALVASTDDVERLLDVISSHPLTVRALDRAADRLVTLTVHGRAAELIACQPPRLGTVLVEATGSPAHVQRLRERGDLGHCASEDAVYRQLDLAPIPPPLREDSGEIDQAAAGDLPQLVDVDDLRGDLHAHTDWSGDGKASLEQMVEAARARGYAYWAATDHAENLSINGLSRDEVLARRDAICRLQEHTDLRILDGAELNIGADGGLDYDLDFLLSFEMCVASIHSAMHLEAADQTARIMAAIAHPAVHVIGHPTGRILAHRPGYEIDLADIVQAAAETGTALEVNGSPRRLDLSGPMTKAAIDAGATIAVSSDAHSVREFGYVRYGVLTAQRGWATAADVLNCRDLDGLLTFTRAKSAV